jgi:hypothetical protein
VVLSVGVALVHTGHETGDPIAAVSSIIILLDTLLFGRQPDVERMAAQTAVPAE